MYCEMSEFLAGISIACLIANVGLVCFLRPRIIQLSLDPIKFSPTKSGQQFPVKSSPVPSDEEENTDQREATPEESTKKEKGSFYSYFT
jgi:hypothetical protein